MTKTEKVIWVLVLLVWLSIIIGMILGGITERCYIQNGYEQRIQGEKIIWVKTSVIKGGAEK